MTREGERTSRSKEAFAVTEKNNALNDTSLEQVFCSNCDSKAIPYWEARYDGLIESI